MHEILVYPLQIIQLPDFIYIEGTVCQYDIQYFTEVMHRVEKEANTGACSSIIRHPQHELYCCNHTSYSREEGFTICTDNDIDNPYQESNRKFKRQIGHRLQE